VKLDSGREGHPPSSGVDSSLFLHYRRPRAWCSRHAMEVSAAALSRRDRIFTPKLQHRTGSALRCRPGVQRCQAQR
jgi:hypothetical protein